MDSPNPDILGNQCRRSDRAKHTVLLLLTEVAAHANAQEKKIRKLQFRNPPPPQPVCLEINNIFYFYFNNIA